MELILISNTKLKIMLDEDDMQEYKLNDDCDCTEPETRKAIRTLLDKARTEVGFNTDGAEIFVQLYASHKGGCEIFVTKSALADPITKKSHMDKNSVAQSDTHAEKRATKRETVTKHKEKDTTAPMLPEPASKLPQNSSKRSGRLAFSFECIDLLISVCHTLYHLGITPKSRAFHDSDGWYLLLSDTDTSAYARLDKLTFILEYGKRENPDCLLTYASEHGKIICHDRAIETLAPLKI